MLRCADAQLLEEVDHVPIHVPTMQTKEVSERNQVGGHSLLSFNTLSFPTGLLALEVRLSPQGDVKHVCGLENDLRHNVDCNHRHIRTPQHSTNRTPQPNLMHVHSLYAVARYRVVCIFGLWPQEGAPLWTAHSPFLLGQQSC